MSSMIPLKPASAVSVTTLERVPVRALVFLNAVARHEALRRRLNAAGFSVAERRIGNAMLDRVLRDPSMAPAEAAGRAVPVSAVSAAREVLESEGPAVLRRIHSALMARHPEIGEPIFALLDANEPTARTLGTVLERLAALAGTPNAVALEMLALRGLDAALRQRLLALVPAALGLVEEPALESVDVSPRVEALRALYTWFTDWATTARTVLPLRGDHIKLGLASQHRQKRSLVSDVTEADAPQVELSAVKHSA